MNRKRFVAASPPVRPSAALLRAAAIYLTSLALSLAWAPHAPAQENFHAAMDSAYVPGGYRVFTGAGEPATLDDVVAEMGRHEVVFIGETHDDPTGHMLEAELLRRAYEAYGVPASGETSGDAARSVALSLEFFEHDVQLVLNEYLAGLITEKAFRSDSRPWERYQTDYRPLIEFAKEKGLAVVAANAPRRYATRVTLHGRESLESLGPEALATLAPLPYGEASEAYKQQWIQQISEVMEQEGKKCGVPIDQLPAGVEGGPAPPPPGAHAMMGNQLQSQVLWDATMAWWANDELLRHPDALVLHMVGSFHVERGTGIPEQLERYRPGASRMIVVLRPVEDVETFEPAPQGEWGEFVIQTDKSHTLEEIECSRLLAKVKAAGANP